MPTIAEVRQQYPQYSDMSDSDLAGALHQKFYSDLPREEFDKKVGLTPVAKAQPSISDAVTDIPSEIGRTFNANLETFKNARPHEGEGAVEGLLNRGKAALAVPGMLASPITGTLRSLIGHPMAQAEHAVGSLIAPEIAAKDDPQKMYETAAGDVDTALSAARPSGFTPKSAPPSFSSKPAIPTVDELKTAARAAYKSPDIAAVEIHPQSVANLSSKIENDLLSESFRPRQAPGTFEEVKALTPPTGVASVKIADIDSARKALGRYADEVGPTGRPTSEAAAAQLAIKHINDYLPNLQQHELLAGDAAKASRILDEARKNWGAFKRSDQAQTLLDNAEIQADSTYSGGNLNNATRQAYRPLLKNNAAKAVGYNPEEVDALSNVVRGSTLGNLARTVGKLAPDGGLKGHAHIGAAYQTGGASIPLSAVSLGAKALGNYSTARNAAKLEEMLRSRSPLAVSNAGMNAVAKALSPAGGPSVSPKAQALAAALMSDGPLRRIIITGGMPANASENKN